MTLTCVACYGVEYTEFNPEFEAAGRVVDDRGNPIPGIEASVGNNKVLTKADGHFYVESFDYSKLTLIDIDGEENGGEFEEKTIKLGEVGKSMELGDIEMTRKQ